jgi:hypothetical protein
MDTIIVKSISQLLVIIFFLTLAGYVTIKQITCPAWLSISLAMLVGYLFK